MHRDPTPLPPDDRERCLDEVVTAYLQAADAGRAPDTDDWLARHPELFEAAALTLERQKLWADNPGELYAVARDLAAAAGKGKQELSAGERDQRRRYADLAIGALRQAVRAGFKDRKRLQDDPALELLRPRDDFKDILAGLGQASPRRGE
jgi:hypothetical protein